jgi:hypothetical protein
MEIDSNAMQRKAPAIARGKMRFDGSVRLYLPPTEARTLDEVTKIPNLLFKLLPVVLAGVISDFFRRLFRSVKHGDVFTAVNVRQMRWIGGIIIIGGVLFRLLIFWQTAVTVAFAQANISVDGVSFLSPGQYSSWLTFEQSIVAGLVILALAEVFNQGIVLKQDTDLTI